jgi:hypothetical protein
VPKAPRGPGDGKDELPIHPAAGKTESVGAGGEGGQRGRVRYL